MNMNKELNYVCKIPSVSEMEQRWDYEISLHSKKENWIVWKAEAIDHFRDHWGFKDYVSSDTETYPDGTVIQVDFYGKSLDE